MTEPHRVHSPELPIGISSHAFHADSGLGEEDGSREAAVLQQWRVDPLGCGLSAFRAQQMR
eukprot:14389100-Alexandrium_andersonii.AAC.1